MRKATQYGMAAAEAWALLERAPVLHVAADGPVLKVVHPVVVDGLVAFHGAPAGEKMSALGRPVVASAHEVVAEIPSHFVDRERACPATTYYRSVQIHGVLEAVEDPALKAATLDALMRKYQPEGGYVPIDPTDDAYGRLYEKAVAGLLVACIRPSRVDGKAKLGQNRTPEALGRVVEGLWGRGGPSDLAAIASIRQANPGVPAPAALRDAPDGVELAPGTPGEALAAAELLVGAYWTAGDDATTIASSLMRSSAWIVARSSGGVVGTVAALTDGVRRGFVLDVVVAPGSRGRGVASALLRALLDHPAVRDCRLGLQTIDAMSLYRRHGFEVGPAGRRRMVRPRGATRTGAAPTRGAGR